MAKPPSPRPLPERRIAALAARRKDCGIVCAAIVASAAADAAKRTALSALVRYATPKGVQRPGDLRTPGVAALDRKRTGGVVIHHEHVVPVRLLVDRMLSGNNPPPCCGPLSLPMYWQSSTPLSDHW